MTPVKIKNDNELARLRAHLVELDRELSEEAERNRQLTAVYEQQLGSVQGEVLHWKSLYEQRVHQIDAEDEDYDDDSQYPADWSRMKVLQEHNRQGQLLSKQASELAQLTMANENLQAALRSMESSMQADLDLALAQTRAIAKEADERARLAEEALQKLKVAARFLLCIRGNRWMLRPWKS